MKQCDEQATKESKGLHFLVIPLVDEPRDEPGWRRISINDIGNAILIKAEDMMAGLQRKALRLSADEYVFSARNETDQGRPHLEAFDRREKIRDQRRVGNRAVPGPVPVE